MSSREFDDEVAAYAAEVRAQLTDLPAEEGAELLEDLEDHLQEVAAEDAGTLRERLGEPAAYARELRQAAGLPEASEAAETSAGGLSSTLTWRHAIRTSAHTILTDTERRIRSSRPGTEVLDFLPALRPAWWVVRAWVAVRVLELMTTHVNAWHYFSLIPRVNYSTTLGVLAMVAAISASVYVGRKGLPAGWWRRIGLAAQGALVVYTVGMAFSAVADENSDAAAAASWQTNYGQVHYAQDGLTENGKQISNVYAYDKDGKLLDGVYLYDQDGQPLQILLPGQTDGGAIDGDTWVDSNGQYVANRFPRQLLVTQWDAITDRTNYVAAPPPAVTIPQGVHHPSDRNGSPQNPAPSNSPATSATTSPTTTQNSSASNSSPNSSPNPSQNPSQNPPSPSTTTAPTTTPATTPPTGATEAH